MTTSTTKYFEDEGTCTARKDGLHCTHWWDGEACCNCKAPAMTEEQKREQGMIDDAPA